MRHCCKFNFHYIQYSNGMSLWFSPTLHPQSWSLTKKICTTYWFSQLFNVIDQKETMANIGYQLSQVPVIHCANYNNMPVDNVKMIDALGFGERGHAQFPWKLSETLGVMISIPQNLQLGLFKCFRDIPTNYVQCAS